MDTEVLVVGAGPTGLVLALWLARLGIQVRIIDKTAGPGSTSRALAGQARTLEFYRQLGFADELVEAGLVFSAASLWARGSRAAHVELGRLGAGKSPFPYGLIYPQDEHERFLIERLEELDVRVERMTELIDFEEVDGRIVARLQGSTCEAACLAGCDGARSTGREKVGISFPGGAYQHLSYGADADATGPPRRSGDEHRHRRRSESGVEAFGSAARPGAGTNPPQLRAGADRLRAPPDRDHRPRVLVHHSQRAPRGWGARPCGAARDLGALPAVFGAAVHVPHRLADRDRVSRERPERGARRKQPRRRSAAVGAVRARQRPCSAVARMADARP